MEIHRCQDPETLLNYLPQCHTETFVIKYLLEKYRNTGLQITLVQIISSESTTIILAKVHVIIQIICYECIDPDLVVMVLLII